MNVSKRVAAVNSREKTRPMLDSLTVDLYESRWVGCTELYLIYLEIGLST